MESKEPDRAWVRQFGLFGWIVSELVVTVGLAALLGHFLRTRLGWGLWIQVGLIVLGFVGAMIRIAKVARKEFK